MTVEEQDARVRAGVYDVTFGSGTPPTARQLGDLLALSEPRVRESLERLAAGRALVLQRHSREVLMANPFSAVPTPFAVQASGRLFFGNCIWDALGIPAMLGTDARIESSCACCGEAMELLVSDGALQPIDAMVHFAVPAHEWWQDIVYN